MLLNGWIGKYYIEVDPTKNTTQGRVINTENGKSVEADFIESRQIFDDLKLKFPKVIEDKDATIIDKQSKIDSLKIKLNFLEKKINLSIADYDKYKTL